MKRLMIAFILCFAVLLAGCRVEAPVKQGTKNGNGTPAVNVPDSDNNDTEQVGNVVEIKEKMFVAQTNEIYVNAEDYLGKTIKYEGIFSLYIDPETNIKYCSVIRYGPGCCGTDGNCGFEVIWDKEYPEENSWVAIEGILGQYEEYGNKYLRITLDSLEVKTERGNEYVTQ